MYFKILYLGFKIYCFIFHPVRMGVRVVMIQNDRIWLVRHTYLFGWFLPGGGLKRHETLEQAAHREAREETGAELRETTLIGVYSNFNEWKTDHTTIFLCKDFNINGKSDGEIAEVQAFPLGELPDNVYSVHRRLIENYRAGKKMPLTGEW